jgi:hypothetical protein
VVVVGAAVVVVGGAVVVVGGAVVAGGVVVVGALVVGAPVDMVEVVVLVEDEVVDARTVVVVGRSVVVVGRRVVVVVVSTMRSIAGGEVSTLFEIAGGATAVVTTATVLAATTPAPAETLGASDASWAGSSASAPSGPRPARLLRMPLLRNARTTAGSNWVPALSTISCRAAEELRAFWYERRAVMAS